MKASTLLQHYTHQISIDQNTNSNLYNLVQKLVNHGRSLFPRAEANLTCRQSK